MTKKNTQNANKPRKEPRQYKHTPNKTKRVVGKIFALVGCLAILLSCLVVPSFADSTSDEVLSSRVLFPSPYSPSQIQFRYDSTNTNYRSITVPYATLNTDISTTSYNVYDDGTNYAVAYYSQYVTGMDRIDIGLSNPEYTDPTTPLRFVFNPFYYSPEYYYSLPGSDTSNGPYFLWIMSESSIYEAMYHISYFDASGQGYRDIIPVSISTPSTYGYIDLQGLFSYIDITSDIFVTELTIDVQYDSAEYLYYDTFRTQFYVMDESTYPYPPINRYSIPSEIEADGLFTWLVDALEGVLSTPLIPIGNYSITIGSVLGMFIGISLVIAFLKFFAGV